MEVSGQPRIETFGHSTPIGELARFADEIRTLVALMGKRIG